MLSKRPLSILTGSVLISYISHILLAQRRISTASCGYRGRIYHCPTPLHFIPRILFHGPLVQMVLRNTGRDVAMMEHPWRS